MSFVESATLRLIDRTSEPVNKINRNLDKLFATAKKLNTLNINVRINARPIDDLLRKVNTLQLRARDIRIDTSGFSTAVAQVNQLAAAMQRAAAASQRLRLPQMDSISSPYGRRGGYFGSSHNATFPGNVPAIMNRRLAYSTGGAMAHDVGSSLRSGFLGQTDVDAQMRLAKFNKATEAEIRAYAAANRSRYGEVSEADIMQLHIETLKNLGRDQRGPAKAVMGELLTTMQHGVLSGQSGPEFMGELFRLTKAAGMFHLIEDAQGKPTPERMTAFMENFRRAKNVEGVDLTPRDVQMFAKYAGAYGKTASDDALFKSMLMMTDVGGARFGTLFRAFGDQASGLSVTEAAKNNQIDAGLMVKQRDGSYAPRGYTDTGGNRVDYYKDRFEWFRHAFVGPEGILTKKGLSVTDTERVVPELAKYFSRSTARDMATMLAQGYGELDRKVKEASQTAYKTAEINKIAGQNPRNAFDDFHSALKNLSGKMGREWSWLTKGAANVGSWGINKAGDNPLIGGLLAGGVALGSAVAPHGHLIAAGMQMRAAMMQLRAAGFKGGMLGGAWNWLKGALGFGGSAAAGAAGAAGAAAMAKGAARNFNGGILGGLGAGAGATLGAAGAGAAGGLLARLFGSGSLSQRFGKLGWAGKLFAGLGVFGAGTSLLSGDLLGTGLGLVGALGPLFGPLGMGLSVAAIIAEMFRGGKANASTLPKEYNAAMGALPKSSQDRAKLFDQRAKEWGKKGVQVDWRKSVVDLMKTMGLDDNGLAARKKLYEQLNKGERYVGSASQNMKLQRQLEAQADQLKTVQDAVKPAANLPDAPKINRPTGWDKLQDDLNWLLNNVKSVWNQFDEYAKWSDEAIKKKRDEAQKQREKSEDELQRKYPQRPDENNFAYQQRLGRMRRDQQYPDGPPKGIESWGELWERFSRLFGGGQPDIMKNWESLDEQIGKSMRDALGQTTAAFEQAGANAGQTILAAHQQGASAVATAISTALANAKISIDPGSGAKPNTGSQASTIA